MGREPYVIQATRCLRNSEDADFVALRQALAAEGLDPLAVALPDFNPESARIGEGVEFERHHAVVVTADDRAFDGWLHIDAAGARFTKWNQIPSRLIPDARELADRLKDNRRARRAWNDGLPPWVTDPRDFLYNRQVQDGRHYLNLTNT